MSDVDMDVTDAGVFVTEDREDRMDRMDVDTGPALAIDQPQLPVPTTRQGRLRAFLEEVCQHGDIPNFGTEYASHLMHLMDAIEEDPLLDCQVSRQYVIHRFETGWMAEHGPTMPPPDVLYDLLHAGQLHELGRAMPVDVKSQATDMRVDLGHIINKHATEAQRRQAAGILPGSVAAPLIRVRDEIRHRFGNAARMKVAMPSNQLAVKITNLCRWIITGDQRPEPVYMDKYIEAAAVAVNVRGEFQAFLDKNPARSLDVLLDHACHFMDWVLSHTAYANALDLLFADDPKGRGMFNPWSDEGRRDITNQCRAALENKDLHKSERTIYLQATNLWLTYLSKEGDLRYPHHAIDELMSFVTDCMYWIPSDGIPDDMRLERTIGAREENERLLELLRQVRRFAISGADACIYWGRWSFII